MRLKKLLKNHIVNPSQIHKWMTFHHLLDEAKPTPSNPEPVKSQELYLHVIGTLTIKRQIYINPHNKT